MCARSKETGKPVSTPQGIAATIKALCLILCYLMLHSKAR